MKLKEFISLISLLLIVPCIAGCGERKTELRVTGGDPFIYICDGGKRITARYYTLSDRSLDFVKLALPDSKEYTLPHVMSASGVRYTDDREIIWWAKGDGAMIERRAPSGEFKTLYNGCVLKK